MKQRFHKGSLAAWSVHHPVGVTMLALAVAVPGLLALKQLEVDLLPKLVYPYVSIGVRAQGVPAPIIEDKITRLVEEQLAVTEGAVNIQSWTGYGQTTIGLFFPYGMDIDTALRDASARLDRAKRLLPALIDPPGIRKRDPSQSPVLEFVVSSYLRSPVDLYDWADHEFSKSLINLPGVSSVEVGGGQVHEIAIDVDQERLASVGLTPIEVKKLLVSENLDASGGRLDLSGQKLSSRIAGRFSDLSDLGNLALRVMEGDTTLTLRLSDFARIYDNQSEEQLRIRLDGVPGIKLSIQKQPQANTIAVVDGVLDHLKWMQEHNLIPPDVSVKPVNDQSIFIRQALRNATYAALSGAMLAMSVVYLFLGNLRRTLIVGSAIPLALLFTFMLMQLTGLTLNIMTLGGLALGVGILVDSTIVMLENIYRHQRQGDASLDGAVDAATEVNSPIVASTSTNLAAVLPFLLIGGLAGLLFRDLIATISAAIVASMVVALTLVPSLAARVRDSETGRLRRWIDQRMLGLQDVFGHVLGFFLDYPWLPLIVLLPGLGWAISVLSSSEEAFLPPVDTGRVQVNIKGDSGMGLDQTDEIVHRIEALLRSQPEVDSVFSIAGGGLAGRVSWFEPSRGTIKVQLVPIDQRNLSSEEWVNRMRERLGAFNTPGFRITILPKNKVEGIRLGQGEDDISLRIAGPDLAVLAELGDQVVARLNDISGLRNLSHSYSEVSKELEVKIDRVRAGDLNISLGDISEALNIALEGVVATDFVEHGRSYDVRLRLSPPSTRSLSDVGNVIVALRAENPIRLRDLAEVAIRPAPAWIFRDRQSRFVEVKASLQEGHGLENTMESIRQRLRDFDLPSGYRMYDDGAIKALRGGQRLGALLLILAIFLVFVVMAVQYESLLTPLVILFSIPFTLIGVAAGLWYTQLSLSMPVWLGLIMLVGIVVNNAIVLVEQIEAERGRGKDVSEAIILAGRLRLRPILMTTLTTVVGMSPLALNIGEGSEMLQPLAVVIVWGLGFSMLVSLVLVPVGYHLVHGRRAAPSKSAPDLAGCDPLSARVRSARAADPTKSATEA